jgi:ABC-type amino acid transport substrate-binding protein
LDGSNNLLIPKACFVTSVCKTLVIIAISVALSWLFFGRTPSHIVAPSSPIAETTYARVMRTKELRCGYINYPPHTIIDPATKNMSGLMHDIVMEMGRLLDIKIIWAEEVGWASTVEALRSKRIDAICTSFWQNPVEGKFVSFTMPVFYSPVTAYVSAKSTHSAVSDIQIFNHASMRISGNDGAMASLIAAQDFPKAKLVSAPNMMDETHMLLDVASGKADITFIETYIGAEFIKNNPDSVKPIFATQPLRVFGNTIAIPAHEPQLKSMLDSALVQMLNGGFVDHAIKAYENIPNAILRVAKPYAYEPVAE